MGLVREHTALIVNQHHQAGIKKFTKGGAPKKYLNYMRSLTVLILAIAGQLVSGDQQKTLAAATSDFSQRLYQKVALDTPNVVYSPYSIHSAMSMALLGARKKTAKEMETTLGVTSLGAATHSTYKDLIDGLKSVHDVVLNTGNAIFLNSNFEILEQYVDDVEKYYYSKADNFDLSAPGGPEKKINDYVAKETNNMIKDVLPEGVLTKDTVMLLVNTIFFNGTWVESFVKARTAQRDFYKQGGEVTKVDMMNSAMTIKYKKDDELNVQVAELPFKGKRFGFYIVLPETADDISSLETLLETPYNVDRLFSGLASFFASVSMPKFKAETTLDLKKALVSLGMVKAFSSVRGVADFSGIRSKGDIYISDAIHKAKIEVQETGTVAAAATVVIHALSRSANSVPKTSLKFMADHPFIYFLRDNQSGQILFQGKFSN